MTRMRVLAQILGLLTSLGAAILAFIWEESVTVRVTVASAVVGVSSVLWHWGRTGRLFPRLIPLDRVLALSVVDRTSIVVGLGPITQFYEWSQDRWASLAKGAGATAVSLLLAVVGFAIGDGVTSFASEAASGGSTKETISTAVAPALDEVIWLTAFVFVVASIGWLRSATVHRDFAEDIAAVSEIAWIDNG